MVLQALLGGPRGHSWCYLAKWAQKLNAGAGKVDLPCPELWGTTRAIAGSAWEGICTISPISNPGLLRVEQPRFLWGYEHFFSWTEVKVGGKEREVGFVPDTVTLVVLKGS